MKSVGDQPAKIVLADRFPLARHRKTIAKIQERDMNPSGGCCLGSVAKAIKHAHALKDRGLL